MKTGWITPQHWVTWDGMGCYSIAKTEGRLRKDYAEKSRRIGNSGSKDRI